MLKKEHIPDQEPQINVGIILPEDQLTSVIVATPQNTPYYLKINNETIDFSLPSKIEISICDGQLKVNAGNSLSRLAQEITIIPKEISQKIVSQQGLKVYPVIAGRGFHWQKNIEVYLPGTIHVKAFNDRLILINKVSLEQYVMCVATSEMSAQCPDALIEAQTITARSWILANVEQKHIALGMDVCNDDCCQRYQGTTFLSSQSITGALNTSGRVIIHDNKICDARYSKSCGGMTESFENIWDGLKHEYLKVRSDAAVSFKRNLTVEKIFLGWLEEEPDVFCNTKTVPVKNLKVYLGSVDEEGDYFRWKAHLSHEEIIRALNKYAGLNAGKILNFNVLNRADSGRITKLEIGYIDHEHKMKTFIINSEYSVRRFLSENFLYSSAFSITAHDGNNDFTLHGAGWGHGVGLCQIGALCMALKGYKTEEIMQHYFPGSTLQKIY